MDHPGITLLTLYWLSPLSQSLNLVHLFELFVLTLVFSQWRFSKANYLTFFDVEDPSPVRVHNVDQVLSIFIDLDQLDKQFMSK